MKVKFVMKQASPLKIIKKRLFFFIISHIYHIFAQIFKSNNYERNKKHYQKETNRYT